ncbi:TcmI family type II polyketide cyclase [Nocardiopsis alba]|uniref:TcmI family type II polyketide cyclase n=1 Tax=Nocardiopsis alba TaxID=53437 RepID=A0A7K2IP73_9ACTN|nr:TcmI family type II polyketide cyclase [Nocardiopsis sp. LDBS1602]MEC3894061.1 TcmI family type II polyketide cyclase [Nocardiopsis sp. LDBS1602]MYR31676.1 TcmI family type II polyketide cyclase [Nocardiopsis alba]
MSTSSEPDTGPYRTLIVARLKPGSEEDIARAFAESDAGELPGLVGVRSRSLFRFGDVYLHLIEGDRPLGPAVAAVGSHPEFTGLSEHLKAYVSAYFPETWRGPQDAMATEFYRWERPETEG